LKRLKNLEVLNLNENQIEEMPDEIPIYLSLKELSMFKNQMRKLPKQMQKMTNLRVLEVSDN
jgi:Leucine-rich repeat (LRR) protein